MYDRSRQAVEKAHFMVGANTVVMVSSGCEHYASLVCHNVTRPHVMTLLLRCDHSQKPMVQVLGP